MSEHTPGPWKESKGIIYGGDGQKIAELLNEEFGFDKEAIQAIADKQKANGNLMVTALDMYKAAKGARDVLGSTFAYADPRFRDKCEALVNAIKKAEGRE